MNERIRELFKKAGGITIVRNLMSNPVQVGEYNELWDDRIDRFAELIVRECVKVMYDNAIERKVPPDINQTPTRYAIAVLEHFGVEE